MFDLIKFLNIIKNNSSTELDIANERTIDFSAAQQSSYSFPDERQQGVHLQLVQLSEKHLLTTHSKYARVWNLDTNEAFIIKSPSSKHGIIDVRRLANNRILFNQLDSADIYIYDWKEQKLICKIPSEGACAVLENGNLVMVKGDKTGKIAIKILDSEQGILLNTFYEKLAKPIYPISIYPVFSLGNDRIAFIIREINTLFVWDIKDGHQISSINTIYTAPAPVGLVCPIVKLSSGKHVVISCRQDVLDVWEVESGSHIQTFKTLGGLSTYLVCNNGQLVAAYKTGDMQVWDLQTGKDIQLLKNAGGSLFQISDNLVVTVPRDGNVKVWDTQNWQCLKVLGGYYTTPSISCVGISDNKLAVLYYDQLKIWEFGYRHLQLQDIIELLKALKDNQTITTLNLAGIILGDPGAVKIADLIVHNQTIITIDLQNTNITDEGAKALLNAIKINQTVKFLDLASNKIDKNILDEIQSLLSVRDKSILAERTQSPCTEKEFFDTVRLGKVKAVQALNYVDTYFNKTMANSELTPLHMENSGFTALHLAVKTCNFNFYKNQETDVNHLEMIKWLLSKGSNPNCQDDLGNTPLHLAMSIQDSNLAEQVVVALLETGADINKKGSYKNTSLHKVITREVSGRLKLIQLLIQKRIKLDEVNEFGEASLHQITSHGGNFDKFNIIKTLLEAKANVNIQDSKGKTALHNVCYYSKRSQPIDEDIDYKTAELLIKYKAEVNIQDKDGNTPLHLAVGANSENLVNCLLKHGANPTIINNAGLTPAKMPSHAKNTFDYESNRILEKLRSMLQHLEINFALNSPIPTVITQNQQPEDQPSETHLPSVPSGAIVKNSSAEEKIKAIDIGGGPAIAHVDNTRAQNITAASLKQTIPARSNNSNNATSPASVPWPLSSPPAPSASVSHTTVGRNLKVISEVNIHYEQKLSPSPEEKRIASQQKLEDDLRKLRDRQLKNVEVQQELAVYVPIQGSNNFEDNELFDVATKVKTFLASRKKILLLLGDSGMGKSLFGRALEKELWEDYDNGKPILLFISLPSLRDPIKNAIDEHLSQLSFKPQQIGQLKKEYSFIFILDGYDEIASHNPDNLYVSNKLSDWKAKVVISCRSQYLLAKKQVYRNRFLPDYKNQPEPGLFQEIMLKPFTPKQIEIYLKKFIEIEKPLWGDWQIYRKHIDVIPGLKSLIETPFLLRITVEVLPDIIGRCETQEEYAALTRLDLYDAFAQRWFERQEYKLRKQGHPIDLEWDIKSDFHNFSQKLAERMLEQKVSEIVIETKVKQRFGQSQAQSSASQWDEFFGNDPTLQLIRSGCPLKKLGENRYAFIHETLLIYFGDRDKFAQSMTPQVKPSVKQAQSPAIHPIVQQSNIFQTPPLEEINLTLEQFSPKNVIKILKQYPNLKNIGIPKQTFSTLSEIPLSPSLISSNALKGRLISKDRFVLFGASPYQDKHSNGEKGYNIALAIYRIKDGALINSFSYKHISSDLTSYINDTEHGTLASLDVLSLTDDLLSVCYTHSYRLTSTAPSYKDVNRALVVFCLFDINAGELFKKTLPINPELKITSFLEKNNRLYINRKFYIDNLVDFIKGKPISEEFKELSQYYLEKYTLGSCLSGILVDFLDNDRLLILQNQILSVFNVKYKKNVSSIKVPYQEKMEFQYVNSQLFIYSKSDEKNSLGYLIDIEVNMNSYDKLKNSGEKKLTDQLLSYFLNDENTLVAGKSNYYILFGSKSHHNNYVFLFDPRTQNAIFSFTLYDKCLLALPISDRHIAMVTNNNSKGELKFTTILMIEPTKVTKYSLDFRSLLKEGCDIQIDNQTHQLTLQLKNASVLSVEKKEEYLNDLKSCGGFISAVASGSISLSDSNSKKGSLTFWVKDLELLQEILEILNALACQQLLINETSISRNLQ